MVDIFLWDPGWQHTFRADIMLGDETVPPDPQLNSLLDYRPTPPQTSRRAALMASGFIDSNWPVPVVVTVPSFDWFYDAAQHRMQPRPAAQPPALVFSSDPATDATLEAWLGVAGQDRRQPSPTRSGGLTYEGDYPTVNQAQGIAWNYDASSRRAPAPPRPRGAEGLIYELDYPTVKYAQGIGWLADTNDKPPFVAPRHPEATGLSYVSDPSTDARLLAWWMDQAPQIRRAPIRSVSTWLTYEADPATVNPTVVNVGWLADPLQHRQPGRPAFQPIATGYEFTPSTIKIDWLAETGQHRIQPGPARQIPALVYELDFATVNFSGGMAWYVDYTQHRQQPGPGRQLPQVWEFERSTIKVDWLIEAPYRNAVLIRRHDFGSTGLIYQGDPATEAVLLSWASDLTQPRRAKLAAAALLASGSTFVGDPGPAVTPPLSWDVAPIANRAQPSTRAAAQFAAGFIFQGVPPVAPTVLLEWFMDQAPREALDRLPIGSGARQDSNQDNGGILSIIPIPPVGEFNYGLTAGPQISDQGGLSASHAKGLGRQGLHGIPQTDPP